MTGEVCHHQEPARSREKNRAVDRTIDSIPRLIFLLYTYCADVHDDVYFLTRKKCLLLNGQHVDRTVLCGEGAVERVSQQVKVVSISCLEKQNQQRD